MAAYNSSDGNMGNMLVGLCCYYEICFWDSLVSLQASGKEQSVAGCYGLGSFSEPHSLIKMINHHINRWGFGSCSRWQTNVVDIKLL